MLPNFMIVGAPKAGTTSLYHYLSEHPDVFMSEPKEVNYFSSEEIKAQGLYYDAPLIDTYRAYQKLFDGAQKKCAVGEGSVSYLFFPKTPQKIKDALPHTKIIILLRNPVERAYSHYLMDYRLGLVDLSFEDIVYQRSNHPQLPLFYQQFVELGMYYEQVKRYLDLFGDKQVKIYLQEDLRDNTQAVVQNLYHLLGVNADFMPNLERSHNAFSMPKGQLIHKLYSSPHIRSVAQFIFRDSMKERVKNTFFERKKRPELQAETKACLYGLYSKDVGKLELLLRRELPTWK